MPTINQLIRHGRNKQKRRLSLLQKAAHKEEGFAQE